MKAPERIWAVYTSDFPELPIHTADLEPFPDAVRTVEYLRSDLSPDKEREVAVGFHHWTRRNNFYQTEDSDEWFAITGDGVAFTTDELFTEYLKQK